LTQQALLPLSELPGLAAQGAAGVDNFVMPRGLGQIPAIWSDPALPICLSQEQEGGWSIGWRWHPSQTFDVTLVSRWLTSLDWRRAKLVIHSVEVGLRQMRWTMPNCNGWPVSGGRIADRADFRCAAGWTYCSKASPSVG
jgi:hypothetical protein